ncbi:MAG: carboxypeptidase regulatory-like domain-containing protein [Bacteroidetes bacterium]|nr:carboxypeptidase regulatory-like domain-containing protein [Bacteroidota bacterium]
MLRNFTLLVVSFLASVTLGFSQVGLGTLKGSVIDANSKQPIPFCKVLIIQNGSVKGGANTDFDGKFQINSISAGEYDVEVRNEPEGYQPTALSGVIVSGDKITFLDNTEIAKAKSIQEIEEVRVVAYRVPLIDKDGGASGAVVTREDIARLPVRSAAGVASTVGGVNAQEGGGISVRGSREDGTYYYIDGIKVRGSSNLPKSAIEEVSVITGGVPANYGDVTGGIISVTTRGPSAQYFGSVEAVTSGFYFKGKDPDGYDGKVAGLDKFGYNLIEGMFSGPLWMIKDSTGAKVKPRLGFLVSANYTSELDPRPLSGGSYRIKKDVRDELIANPLSPTPDGNGTIYNVLYLRKDDFEKTDYRVNAQRKVFSGQGKIDVNTGPNVNLTFGGSMNYNNSKAYSYSGSLLNFANYGVQKSLDWRVFGRLTQRFSNDREGSSSKIGSAYYSLMVDYSKSKFDAFDPKHGYNLFNYGHVGTFTTTRVPTYAFNDTLGAYEHNGFRDVRVDYEASESNTTLAAITTQYYNLFAGRPEGNYENLTQIQQGNALRNGDSPQSVYNIWANIGSPYNFFGKTENDQIRFTASGSANIGDHSVSLGFEYEQRVDRGWSSGTGTGGGTNGPISLWTTARNLANFHIRELDKSQSTTQDSGTFKKITYERLNSGYAYTSNTGEYGGQGGKFDANGNVILDNQSFFDYNVRKKLGLDPAGTDFIDIDQYDPNMFSFDMFSPDELLNSGSSFVSYYGYDHTGKKVRGKTDVNNYFSKFDENGNYERFVGAFQPIYGAAYIMDKFAFNDLVFNVGVRLDYFNANQPVLKDPYLLYDARTVAEAKNEATNDPDKYNWVVIPESMGDDFTVYVNDVNNPTAINGFRKGSTFYNAEGTEVTDSKVIRGAGGIAPWLIDPSQSTPKASAFEAYKPQINVMPRIAFSFPVSDEASFFAHYDILTKRPTSNGRFDPFDYQFLALRSAIIDNPNLKAEKTVDYEIGFQQVVSKTSSIKVSAFYREQRNNVQLQSFFDAYPNTYNTYSNRDFGTVKGMTIAYDLRRTGNVRITANYTLQFADGTGSNTGSAIGLINAGVPNLRNIAPYSFDQRHAFAVTVDYRYGSGKDYNGPVINNFNLFENTGLNIFTNIYSGSPYTRQLNITNEGSFSPQASGTQGTTNGSRLPWSYRLDLQLDRTIELKLKTKEDKPKVTFLNVYVRVTNMLNQFNRLNVYRATGNWDDDGYLAAAESQATIQNQADEQSFRDYYQLKIANPFNISIPRTIRLGVKFDF